MRKIKPGCTTRYAGLAYRSVLCNSDKPFLRNTMEKFRGEKEEKKEKNSYKNDKSPNFVWEN